MFCKVLHFYCCLKTGELGYLMSDVDPVKTFQIVNRIIVHADCYSFFFSAQLGCRANWFCSSSLQTRTIVSQCPPIYLEKCVCMCVFACFLSSLLCVWSRSYALFSEIKNRESRHLEFKEAGGRYFEDMWPLVCCGSCIGQTLQFDLLPFSCLSVS